MTGGGQMLATIAILRQTGSCHAKHRPPGPGGIGIGPALHVPGVFSVTIVANQRTASHSHQ